MDSNPPSIPGDVAVRIARIVRDVRARRATGESLSDETVLREHPDLQAQLAPALHRLEMIQRARRLAGAADGSSNEFMTPAARLAPDSIPGYEILREIHRGSQGVVYQAIQRSTHREVAIKVMKQGPFADSAERTRFEREVRVLSALKHPNIVSIHDSGVAGGHSYFVMNYIEGEPFDTFVTDHRCTVDEILKLFVKICDAVNAAQICGIIHRDLKPGNIRIDRAGEPHVLDFGLAKIDPSTAIRAVTDETALALPDDLAQHAMGTFTQTGQFVGSLPWSSPEQAEGMAGSVDVRTDVYSLGVILFQVLTGRFPYPVTGSLKVVLDNIQNAAPYRPSALRREINDEVETIILKCLQKDRERRYESAGELSRDVQRYLRGEPLEAKRDSHFYVLGKHLRRYRVIVTAVLAVIASLIGGIIGTMQATARAQRAEADARIRAITEFRLRKSADWETYKACLAAADAALTANNTAMAKARLDAAPSNLRGWEWRYLNARLDQSLATWQLPAPPAAKFVTAPDGRNVLIALEDHRLIALDPLSGNSRTLTTFPAAPLSVALSSDGRRIAFGHGTGEVSLCWAEDGHEIRRFQAHAGGPVTAVAFSADGKLLASSGGLPDHSPDSIRVFDSETTEPRIVLPVTNTFANMLAFSADARLLASGHSKTSAGFRLWDLQRATEMAFVNYEGQDVRQIEFSPDGAHFAVASQDSTVRLYDLAGREIRALTGHSAGISHIAFNSDGTQLASASADLTLRLWDLKTGATLVSRRGHLNLVSQVAFIAENRLLSMSFTEPALKIWDVASGDEPLTFDTGKYFVLHVLFSADGRRLYTHQRCWDTVTGAPLARLAPRDGWEVFSWIIGDDSLEWLSTASGPPRSALLRNGLPLIETNEALLFRTVASPDQRRIVVALGRGALQVYGIGDGRRIWEIPISAGTLTGAAFSHDGASLLLWHADGRWKMLDADSGREKLAGAHGSTELVSAVFSADDRFFATASYDGAARICDAVTGALLRELRPTGAPLGDQSVVWSVAFSPDGTRLATGSKDRRIRLWDIATGQELFALARHAGTIMCLDWSPDGTQLASGGFDGTVCVWDSLSRAQRLAQAAPPMVPPVGIPTTSPASGPSR